MQNSQILQLARNLLKLRAILAHFQRNLRANSAQILHFSPRFSAGTDRVPIICRGRRYRLIVENDRNGVQIDIDKY